jgi:hypothetical protein
MSGDDQPEEGAVDESQPDVQPDSSNSESAAPEQPDTLTEAIGPLPLADDGVTEEDVERILRVRERLQDSLDEEELLLTQREQLLIERQELKAKIEAVQVREALDQLASERILIKSTRQSLA